MHRLKAAASTTLRLPRNASAKVTRSSLAASGLVRGSESYTPSTPLLDMRTASHLHSRARCALTVSVEK